MGAQPKGGSAAPLGTPGPEVDGEKHREAAGGKDAVKPDGNSLGQMHRTCPLP